MDIALRIDSIGATRGGAGTGRTYISETIDLIREWTLPFAVAPAGENDISVSLSHPFDLDPAPLKAQRAAKLLPEAAKSVHERALSTVTEREIRSL